MKTSILALSLIFTVNIVFSQISEYFNSEFVFQTSLWKGDSSKFTINSLEQLQLNDNQAGIASLTKVHQLDTLNWKQWEFQLRLNFSPSSGNYARIYLASPDSVLNSSSQGLYLQFGESGSGDIIRFIHDTGTTTELMTGPPNLINSSFDIQVRIRVDSSNLWRLEIYDELLFEYIVVDSAYGSYSVPGEYFGLYYQYTSSNATKFYLDNVIVGSIPVDTFPPQLLSLEYTYSDLLSFQFEEELDTISLDSIVLSSPVGNLPAYELAFGPNNKELQFSFSSPLENDSVYTFILSGYKDVLFNEGDTSLQLHVLYGEPCLQGDVIFNELMIDPSPSLGLPEVEYIELYNRSEKLINLHQFLLVNDEDTLSLAQGWLRPNTYVLLCSPADTTYFTNCIGVVSFPNLSNNEDKFVLIDTLGEVLDEIAYNADYFQGEVEAGNGRSLALKFPNYFCKSSQAWEGSSAPVGGSPGKANFNVHWEYDTQVPRVEFIEILDTSSLGFHFNESMEYADFSGDTLIIPDVEVVASAWLDNTLKLRWAQAFPLNEYITLKFHPIADCNGNFMDTTVSVLIPDRVQTGDVIISEVLFNPVTGGSDYVELYNRSEKYISLKGVGLGKSEEDMIFIDTPLILAPYAYVYFSADVSFQEKHYPFVGVQNGWEMNLPNFPNDSGRVILADSFTIYDVFVYSEKMHFQYFEDVNGVSLERVNLMEDEAQWYSAGSAVNYGTPGYKNSQFSTVEGTASLTVSPQIITPNGDGEKDFTSIYYSFEALKYMLTLKIYNEEGVLVKILKNNVLNGDSGFSNWSGFDENNHLCGIGNYIVVAEFLDLETQQLQVCRQILILSGK
ncbi:Lamin Tail Domain [Lishizhenia tianjinensis]|uniref:Lamin Tail Domain n=1 Tax=Lishizhenia tianjinensis TaxID=477690 RepID=A0A1I6ZMH2_9FLAO|nr:lamin tail domain-containing protein [Lishizhenia tianjinensis]SFT63918.1 Lamin Tail Domain [Lishizhenia tianjinensis]